MAGVAWVVLASCVATILVVQRSALAQMASFAAEADEEITVDAESMSYDKRMGVVSATGDVVIRRGKTVLRADSVTLNRETNEAEAVGNTSLITPEGSIRARWMRLNLEEETGALLDAEVHGRRLGYSIWGERIEKGVGQTYRIVNGRFTTCQCAEGPPSWSIASEKLDVDLEGYGEFHGATFNILDVPVVYVPRAAFPVHTDRHSGLLFPRVGLSNRRGIQLLQPFYWAISKSQDATIGVDIETAARFGLLGEYRYALSRSVQGSITAAYFNEVIRGKPRETSTSRDDDPCVPENRWGLLAEHTQRIGPVDVYVDLMRVGDKLFFREINTYTIDQAQDVVFRTLPFTTSRIGFVHRWGRGMLRGEAILHQDLIGPDEDTLQRVPELSLTGQKNLGFNVLSRMTASVTNFQRERGVTGLRADLKPTLQLRLPLGRAVFGSLQAGFRETAYHLTDNDEPDKVLPRSSTRETVELRADLSSGIARVFDFPHLGVDKLKHSIEPRVEYLYIPDVSQDDQPVFDGVDRVSQRSLMTYGVSSRLLARSAAGVAGQAGEVYELTRLSVSQSYDVLRRTPGAGGEGEEDHFSDLDFALRVNPSRTTSVRLYSTYDTSNTELSSATVEIHLRQASPALNGLERRSMLARSAFNVAYRFIKEIEDIEENAVGGDREDLQQVDSSLLVPLTDRIGFRYATRYNITKNRFLENHFGLRLLSACDCWSLEIGVTDKSNPNEVELRAQLTLVGLGAAGSAGGFATRP